MRLEDQSTLKQSLLRELGAYINCDDLAEIEKRCIAGSKSVEQEWRRCVNEEGATLIERFYDQTQAFLYDLVWWHTLAEDDSPLAYVVAMQFAQEHTCSRYLDFGSGISSGGILFAQHGFTVASADISSSLLRFSHWRFQRRNLAAQLIDLKERTLPHQGFDFVTALDVWEHLADPVGAVDAIAATRRTGGFLYGRFAVEPEDDRPQHIVRDFQPVFARLCSLGLTQVWEDEWLWGHRVF